MSIREYVRKRKFAATPEPKPLRFYVQEHHATRLHYDLRLEIDGVLKSWALPKPPSFDPAITRLAVEVEDHPLEYGSFEGTIPKGNYGAGEVTVWDRGTYVCRNGDPSRAKDEGHLTLIFSGKRLRGEFALVRTEKASKQVHWLFIKKRDGYAHFGSTDTGDLSAPGTTLFRPVKRRGPPVDLTSTAGWILEPWDEGTRVIASWDGGEVHYYSRDLLPLKPKVDARALARLRRGFAGSLPACARAFFRGP